MISHFSSLLKGSITRMLLFPMKYKMFSCATTCGKMADCVKLRPFEQDTFFFAPLSSFRRENNHFKFRLCYTPKNLINCSFKTRKTNYPEPVMVERYFLCVFSDAIIRFTNKSFEYTVTFIVTGSRRWREWKFDPIFCEDVADMVDSTTCGFLAEKQAI